MEKTNLYIKTISADRFTPLVVFQKLNGIALLESSLLEMGKSRYSIILVEEAFNLSLQADGVYLNTLTEKKCISKECSNFLSIVYAYGKKIIPTQEYPIPIPARGVGYLSYETCRFFDEIKLAEQKERYNIPEGLFSFGSVFAIFDHYKDELNLVIMYEQNPENKANEIIKRLSDFDFRSYQHTENKYPCEFSENDGKADFISGVKTIKKEIVKGNLLQGVIARTLQVKTDLPPLEAYSKLRRENPSPYLFYLNFKEFKLFGSSPEVMIRLEGNTATIKPIAGTRPRGKTLAEDTALEKELLADPKELAEHLMLIDLARNDLGRVAQQGSVKPHALYTIERYSHVMHIVSEIQGELAKDKNLTDLIAATFPAGTVSGAPKIQAIETISQIEKNRRGPYAGLVGYFDINSNFDSCITIRSVLYKDNCYYVSAGAGIVYDSDPEKEYVETQNKAKATLKSLGVNL